MTFRHKRIKTWFPVIMWAAVIFFVSHQPDMNIGLPTSWDYILRKLAHITEYAVLTFLTFRAFQETGQPFRRAFIGSITLSFLYAITDEYHQTFIRARQGEAKDVLIDTAGIFFMSFWILGRNGLFSRWWK